MTGPSKTSTGLIKKNALLKQQIQKLERVETERLSMEQAYKDSEIKYRSLIEHSSDVVFCVDENGKYKFVNEVFASTFGKAPDYFLGKTFWDIYPKEHADHRQAASRKVFETGESQSVEVVVPLPDRTLYYLAKANPVRDETGKVVLNLTHAVDITERKRVEQELSILAEIGQIISSTIDIDDVYEAFAEQVKKILSFDRIVISIICSDKNNTRNVYIAGEGILERNSTDIYPIEGSGHSEMLRTKSTLLIQTEDFSEYQDRFPRLSSTFQAGFRSIMNVPLFSKGEIIGAILLRSRRYPAYNESDKRLAERIGTQIAGAIANAQMFSDLKKTEKSLRESEERYQSLFEQAGDGIFILDTHGNIISVNTSSARMHGFTVEEMLCRGFGGLDVEGTTPVSDRISRIMHGETLSFEVEHYHKDGHIFPLAVTTNLISMGNENMIIAIHRDLTERKRAEEEKQRSLAEAERMAAEMAVIAEIGRVIGSTLEIEEVYERLAAETKKLILFDRLAVNLHTIHGENVKVAYVSGEEVSGRRRGDLFPMKDSICEVLTRTRAGLLNYPQNAGGGMNGHFRHHDAPVQMRMSSLLRVPLIYRNEVIGSLFFGSKTPNAYTERDLRLAEKIGAQVAGALGSAKLFSEHKQAEIEKQSLQERLQRSEKMEALGQLAGGVAHDLNNVLGILSGYSELLLEEIPERSQARGHAEKILQSTEKGAAIIQDLLTLARRGVTTSDVVNLNSVVSGFLKTPVFEKMKDYHPRVTFRTELDPTLLNIKGSPLHLEKTLINLVSNATESISGKGEVTIRTESRYIDKHLRGYDEVKDGDYAVLTVSDTGIGIPVESREKIFEPFYTKKKMGKSGTGLGLAIVWGTVKDHNGYIDLQTEVGEGTTFTLYFPVTREEMIAQQQKMPMERYMGKGESVLVVDDIAEQQDIATCLLRRLGYVVHAVSGGEAAVEYLKSNDVDILVLDMIMDPGMDGLETYERVLTINPRQKAIIVSGFSETERVKDAQKLGAGAYVKKPYVIEKIGMAIREELNRK